MSRCRRLLRPALLCFIHLRVVRRRMQRCYYNLEILTPLGLNRKKLASRKTECECKYSKIFYKIAPVVYMLRNIVSGFYPCDVWHAIMILIILTCQLLRLYRRNPFPNYLCFRLYLTTTFFTEPSSNTTIFNPFCSLFSLLPLGENMHLLRCDVIKTSMIPVV